MKRSNLKAYTGLLSVTLKADRITLKQKSRRGSGTTWLANPRNDGTFMTSSGTTERARKWGLRST